jgi:class 3 adenylate cyclase
MKQVTVLFCDIVGSTSLTERLGAEAMRDLVSSFLATSHTEIDRYGGTAPQFTGDGFMALFGAPVTQEDHVQRALLTALAIQRALGGTKDTSDPNKLNLPVRIGIHTGPVVFGSIGSRLPMDYTAIGDTANVAARIQQAAEPATILLSDATYELAQSYARVEPVGPLVLKGKAEPITAYRLLDASQARAAIRPSTETRRTTFVDRQSAMALLDNFLRQVEGACRQAVSIVGEPGIGKSRLLAEFQRHLASDRVTWIEGRCVSYGTAIPYLLMIDLLRCNCGILETDTPTSIIEKVRSGLERIGMAPDQNSPALLLAEQIFERLHSRPYRAQQAHRKFSADDWLLAFNALSSRRNFCTSKGVRGERCIVAPALRTQTRKFQLGKTCAMPRSSRSQERKLGTCFDAMADG